MEEKNEQSSERDYRVVQNEGKVTWRVEELWDGGVVRSPFGTKAIAVRREEDIARAEGFIDNLSLKETVAEEKSPCEAFEKDSDGNWHCITPVSIEIEKRVVVIGKGTTFIGGVLFTGIDVAKWLEENCS